LVDQGTILKWRSTDVKQKALKLIRDLSRDSDRIPSAMVLGNPMPLEDRRELSSGGSSNIYRAVYNGSDVILKVLRSWIQDDDKSPEEQKKYFHKKLMYESLVWRSLNHPHILPFLGLDLATFSSDRVCLVLPFMSHGSIRQYREEKGPENINVGLRLREIAEALEYLHNENIVHGDLCGANVLIDSAGQVQVADFGLTILSDTTATESKYGGHVHFMAPEIIGGLGEDPEAFEDLRPTKASDVYAFGCVCYELYKGHAPYELERDEFVYVLHVLSGEHPDRPTQGAYTVPSKTNRVSIISLDMPDAVWLLVNECWGEKNARPDMKSVVMRSW